MLKADLSALSTLLGDQPYLLGDEPCHADATLFGILDAVLYDGTPNPGPKAAVEAHANLVAYVGRVRGRYFPELAAPAAAAAAAEGGSGSKI